VAECLGDESAGVMIASMKMKFEYKKPLLIDLSMECAMGAVCSAYGNDATDWNCQGGSCPASSQCATGIAAQACYTNGSKACHAGDPNCLGCCQSGSSVSSPGYACTCKGFGSGAVWQCGYGGNATQECASGGNWGYGHCL
jgi:hypothetical protein